MEGKRGEENIPSACDSAKGREERRGRKGRGNAHLDLSAGRLYNYFSVPVFHTGARSRSRSIRALPATVIVPCKNLLCSLSLRGTFEWPRVSPLSTPSHSADASGRRHRHNHARSVRLFADRRSTTWRAPSTDRRVAAIAISAQRRRCHESSAVRSRHSSSICYRFSLAHFYENRESTICIQNTVEGIIENCLSFVRILRRRKSTKFSVCSA